MSLCGFQYLAFEALNAGWLKVAHHQAKTNDASVAAFCDHSKVQFVVNTL